ncbi:MAG: hypothetical protein IJB65_08130 [Clostridia bacterium]|nr:hypothetical protein [Clostridia bacterium]
MKKLSTFLRVLAAVFACLFVLLSALVLMVRLCFLDEDRYVNSILNEEFYQQLEKDRARSLDALGTMIEVNDGVFDKYASVEDCRALGEKYVRALVYDLMNGKSTAAKIKFDNSDLLNYLKADYAGYDFTQAGFKTSDAAAEAAYTMICDRVNTAVLFVPEKIMGKLDVVSRLIALAAQLSFFWFVPLLLGLGLYAFVVLSSQNRINGLFGASASFWCAAVLCFMPVLVLFLGTNESYLDLDRNSLYFFLNGCVSAVRTSALLFVGVFFGLATVFVAAFGLKATAPRYVAVPAPTVADDELQISED